MRRIAAACALATIAGCASTGKVSELGGTTSSSTTSAMQAGGGANGAASITLTNTAAAAKSSVNLPIDKAWIALDKAYTVLTIAPTERDAVKHQLGNTSFRVRRKLGDVALIRALDCGGDNSSPNAETFDITLSIVTRLTSDAPNVTQIETLVQGTGVNALTNNINPVPCYSTGGIEKRLTDLVKQAGNEAPGITMTRKPPME